MSEWLNLSDYNCVTKRVWFLRETMKFFLDENHLWGKKVIFFWVNIFHFGCHCRIQNNFLWFHGFHNTKTTFHLFTSQPFTRNALQCNDKGSFCYGLRNIFLGSSQEKRTVTALARRGETPPTHTAPAGWKTPCWQGPGCPPAHPPAFGSWWSSSFILCIFFGYKSSACGLVWLAAATADAAAQKLHDLSI